MVNSKDVIYSQPQQQVTDFSFDQSVVEVFPDMIQRSIPGYTTILDNIGQLAAKYATEGSRLYDLGCSLGAASLSMRRYLDNRACEIIAVDNSAAMIERAKLHLGAFKSAIPVELICDDLNNLPIHNASVVVMNFTLQFLPPEQRADTIQRIYDGLNPGGILVLSEKISHPDETGNHLLVDLHHEFKRRNGYSELEISQKRTALENVMKTDTFDVHQQRLKSAGFSDVVLWFKCFNFASMVAIKG